MHSITPVFAVLSRRLMFAHACCLPRERQTGRLAGCCVSIPPWVEIAGSAFSWCRCGYLPWRVHFGFVRFFMAIPTGYRDAGTELRGGRGWRRGLCASLRNRIGLVSLSAGRTLGLRAPDCAKESSTLWTLFTLRRGYAGAYSRRLCVFAQPHWLSNAFRGEYAGAARPKPAPKSLRLSGLSSRCGGAALVRVRRAVIRALSET